MSEATCGATINGKTRISLRSSGLRLLMLLPLSFRGASKASAHSSSCPALCRASTSLLQTSKKDVDGRVKPGHDEL
jgi:hypothetical protein